MTTQDAPPAGRGKVPVWRTAIGSYGFVFGNLDRFLALGWLLLVITFAVNMASGVLADVGAGESRTLADWVTYIVLSAAGWAMYIVFAVRWHRFFLLDERESVFSDVLGARNWRFIGYTLLLTFAPIVSMLVFLLIGFGITVAGAESAAAVPTGAALEVVGFLFPLAAFILVIVLFIVMFRFYLVLPATAVDRPLALGEAWGKMRGNTWRFIGALLLVSIPFVILIRIVSAIFGLSQFTGTTSGAPEPTIGVLVATNAVGALFGFLWTAAGITVLSKFYHHIVGGESGEGGADINPA